MAKIVKVSETKAYKIEAIEIEGKKMISIRQLYQTKKDPNWKAGRNGITIPYDEEGAIPLKVIRVIKKMVEDPDLEFTKIKMEKN
jgi:hypothetical protein